MKPEEKSPSVIYKAFDAVDEQWRRRGIGKRLVEEAFAQVGFRIYPAGVEAS